MSTRLCARPGCGEQAAASLAYDYASRTVWLDDLGAGVTATSGAHLLCANHAERTGVPVGWALEDRRREVVSLRSRLAG